MLHVSTNQPSFPAAMCCSRNGLIVLIVHKSCDKLPGSCPPSNHSTECPELSAVNRSLSTHNVTRHYRHRYVEYRITGSEEPLIDNLWFVNFGGVGGRTRGGCAERYAKLRCGV